LPKALNSQILETTQPEQFVTLFLAIYDVKKRSLQYINAGHVPPAVFTSTGEHSRLSVGGPLVGVVPHPEYLAGICKLNPGDTLFVCSDGITENRDTQDTDMARTGCAVFLDFEAAVALC